MGLIHTPRVLRSIARGWLQRRNHLRKHRRAGDALTTTTPASKHPRPVVDPSQDDTAGTAASLILPPASGMGLNHGRHMYEARAGLIDYAFGHLNNASYLVHAELARWQMLAYSGVFPHMMRTSTLLVVAGNTIRYRREIKPFYFRFRIESYLGRIDGPRMWAVHDFFVDERANTPRGEKPKSRAQLVVPCAWVRNGAVVDPASYLREAGVDDATIQSMCDGSNNEAYNRLMDVTSQYAALEESMRRLESMRST